MNFKNKLFILVLFFVFYFFISNNILSSCYYENYNYLIKSTCLNSRDLPNKETNISKLVLEFITSSNEIDSLIFENNKIYGLNIYSYSEFEFFIDVFEYNVVRKRFDYKGSYKKGFLLDLDSDNSHEIVYEDTLNDNIIYVVDDSIYKFELKENESLWFAMNIYIFTREFLGNNLSIRVYQYSTGSLQKKYEINMSSDFLSTNPIESVFVYDRDIYFKLGDSWFKVNNNNVSLWESTLFYQRDSLTFVNLQNNNFYLNIPSRSFFKNFPQNFNSYSPTYNDPLYSIVRGFDWDGQILDLLFVLSIYNNDKKLEVYDLSTGNLIFSTELDFFQANNKYLFFSKEDTLYYTKDFNNILVLINVSELIGSKTSIDKFYLYDLDKDNLDELIIFAKDYLLIFNDEEEAQVDYFIKKVSFPEPYTAYSNHFNITVCSSGYQIIPFNITVETFHHKTKLKNMFKFENVFLHSNSCKNFKIHYIPFKSGNITINVSIEVNDKEISNNLYSLTKEVLSDFYSFNIDNLTIRKNINDDFLIIDLNDDLTDGYENFTYNLNKIISKLNLESNTSFKDICNFFVVDYNNDNISEFLFDCIFYDFYFLIDPINKLLLNFSYLEQEDFSFFVSQFSDKYSVILPWNNYTGYIDSLKTDENNLPIILVDYNLDNSYDFLIYPWALAKEVLDYKIIGKNLRLDNLFLNVYFDYTNKKFSKEINFDLLYKGLFNKSEEIPISIFGEDVRIPVAEEGETYIPISRTPYHNFNILKIKHTMKSEFKTNKTEIKYNDYNPLDNRIEIKFCDLKIKEINTEDIQNPYLEIENPCNKEYKLEIYNKENLIMENTTVNNKLFLNPSILDNELLFVVYYKEEFDNNYANNIKQIFFDLNKLITISFNNEEIKTYFPANISFEIKCLKDFELNLSIKCRISKFNYTDVFFCGEKKDFNIPIIFESSDKCVLQLLNPQKNIDIKTKIPLKFKISKEIKRLKINDKTVIIIEIDNEKKAYVKEDKKIIDVCEKEIKKEDFSAFISLVRDCLKIIKVEIPDFLEVIEINTTGVSFKSNKNYIIYTFDNEISFKTKSLSPITEEEKEKYNVINEKKEEKMEFFNKIALYLSFLSFFSFLIISLAYFLYNYHKKKILEEKKIKALELQKLKRLKEEERKKAMEELLKKKKELFIEEEAKKLLTWVKFLLSTYDEKEIEEYLIKKGYPKEIVKKAFELYKKDKSK